MNRQNNKIRGFTLVELMLAMGFVSALLIAISMTVIQIGNIYNRGITLKEVNQTGKALSVELQNEISQTAPFSLKPDEGHYVVQPASGPALGGRLCLGSYSYIWNYGSVVKTGSLNQYEAPNSAIQLRFVKVGDVNSLYCVKSVSGTYKAVVLADAIELLTSDSNQLDLAVHKFDIESSSAVTDSKTGQQLYNIDFMLGTNDQGAISILGTGCKVPTDITSDTNYCSINEFNIVARAGNKAK